MPVVQSPGTMFGSWCRYGDGTGGLPRRAFGALLAMTRLTNRPYEKDRDTEGNLIRESGLFVRENAPKKAG